MQQQRPHDQSIASLRKASLFAAPHFRCLASANDALGVRTRHHVEGTIIGSALVEMDANGDQLLQYFQGRLDVPAILFPRPSAQTRRITTFAYRYAQVLVHRHQPIDGFRLLEESALHGDVTGRQNTNQCIGTQKTVGKAGAPRLPKQSARSGAVGRRKLLNQLPAFDGIEQAVQDCEALPLE